MTVAMSLHRYTDRDPKQQKDLCCSGILQEKKQLIINNTINLTIKKRFY